MKYLPFVRYRDCFPLHNLKVFASLSYAGEDATNSPKKKRHLIRVVLPLVSTGMLIICTVGYLLWKRLRKHGKQYIVIKFLPKTYIVIIYINIFI